MIIRQAAFEKKGTFLKGNTHTHTTRSDGQGSPETTMRDYASMGFDFLALTDHRIYNYKSYAPDTGLMILPGMELDFTMPGPGIHCVHLVSIGPDQQDGNRYEQDQAFERVLGDTAAEVMPMLNGIRQAGNVPIFCHPEWSGTCIREIEQVTGFSLMEIWNSGCAISDGLDSHAAYWDELLCDGRRVFGVASDDSHHPHHNGHGYVMVKAEKSPAAILKALENGEFYASCGPEIYDFYVENDKAVVICSPAARIRFRHFRSPYGVRDGENITAHQQVIRDGTNYIRAEVVDAQGRQAWTNPIFLDEKYWEEIRRMKEEKK